MISGIPPMLHYIPNPASRGYTHLMAATCVAQAEHGEEFVVALYAYQVETACRAAYDLALERAAKHIENRDVPAPSWTLAAELRAMKAGP